MEERVVDREPAIVDLRSWRKVQVAGSDALAWLDDLVSNRIEGIRPGESRRTLLLDRTGRVQADFRVAPFEPWGKGLLLLQDPVQPKPVDAILAPYVLSSDVDLRDVSGFFHLFATWGKPRQAAVHPIEPSVTGTGWDHLLPANVLPQRWGPAENKSEITADALDAERIRRGVPRFGVDLGPDSLPQEAGLERFIDTTKGCFLGQEAVAKVRNLGHPTHVVTAFRSEAPVPAGAPVFAGKDQAGIV